MTRWPIVLAAGLAGCGTVQKVDPPPPPPAPVLCAPSAAMTDPEPVPLKPQGDYSQKDVAEYITELHQWGSRGWAKLAEIRRDADECIDRATIRTGTGPR